MKIEATTEADAAQLLKAVVDFCRGRTQSGPATLRQAFRWVCLELDDKDSKLLFKPDDDELHGST